MIKRIFSIFLMGLLIIPAIAQDIDLPNNIVSNNGLSVSYPQGWFASSQQGSIVVTGAGGEFGGFNETISADSGTDTLQGAMDYLLAEAAGQVVSEVQSIDINGRPGLYFTSEGLAGIEDGENIQLVFEADNGTIVAAVMVTFNGLESVQDTFFAIVNSAVYMMPVEPNGGIGDGAGPPMEGDMISGDRVLSDIMPPETTTFEDGVLTLSSGLRAVIPERFSLPTGLGIDIADYENTALLYNENFTFTLTIMDDDSLGRTEVINIMVPLMAMMAGDEDYSQEDLTTITLQDGLEVDFYNSLVSAPEDEGFVVLVYVVPITPARVVTVQLQGIPETEIDEEAFLSDMLMLVESLQILGLQTVAEADGSVSIVTEAACNDDGMLYVTEAGPNATIQCPAGCGESGSGVWGTDIYTNDSGVCEAAIHAGVITNEGGLVAVTYVEGQDSYTGSERNGITTSDYGSWGGSFSVSAPESE
jgi:hypothetical protein